VDLAARWRKLLRAEAGRYADVALANIKREFPADVHHTMTGPGDFPFRPRARSSRTSSQCISTQECQSRLP